MPLISVFMSVACVLTAIGLCSLISSSMIPPTFFFSLKIADPIQGFLWFHINFWIIFSSSVKNTLVF